VVDGPSTAFATLALFMPSRPGTPPRQKVVFFPSRLRKLEVISLGDTASEAKILTRWLIQADTGLVSREKPDQVGQPKLLAWHSAGGSLLLGPPATFLCLVGDAGPKN
jgi:hypothetical protein